MVRVCTCRVATSPAQNFAYLAAGRQGRKEEFYLFHGGGNHRLQINGSEHRNSRHLRGGCTLRDGLLIALPQQLPVRRLPWSRKRGNDAQLLPKLGDGAQNRLFSDFPAQKTGKLGDVGVSRLEPLVGLNGQWRDLARTGQLRAPPPVAVSPQGIHVGQDPGSNHVIGLLAGVTQQVQPHGYAVLLKPYQQFLG